MLNQHKETGIYIIHENPDWTAPLLNALKHYELPCEDWFLNELSLPLDAPLPQGVFYNRMSASSHTRDHRYALEIAAPLLARLEAAGRKVINPIDALRLEMSKAEQYIALNRFGIQTPRTIAANSKMEILKAAQNFKDEPFILKPNRGGKGTGVMYFASVSELSAFLHSPGFLPSPDGISLIQQYIKPADQTIRRLEFIGSKFHYAVQVDVSEGFELCPADHCETGDAFCPVGTNEDKKEKFRIDINHRDEAIPQYESFLQAHNLHIAAIEYVENDKGERYVYDINTNTNYNSDAEKRLGNPEMGGMRTTARYLESKLALAHNE